ncbi:MAG: hypothetical protein COT73_01910 [Bdellovibrio sp. CG10_big_fil_rev_8_21_14_0_10_47_8]|nr:MAG: hypothetical protein COT73_01910 [Bdellovibrio sp. CG10_big_fil_rev_8_21_14_0_10_47_8]
MHPIKYLLPEVYGAFLPNQLLNAVIEEKKATCNACAMAPQKEKGKITYQDHLKCCTYEPYLPNFLVGAMFKSQSTSASARAALKKKIHDREFSLPVGLVAAVPFQVEFNQRKPNDFGNREDWLCPYYDRNQQQCGVWKYRGAVCTSFYCKSSYGQKGLNFWDHMSNYLTYVEMALMEDVLVDLGFSPRQISDCLVYLNVKEATPEQMQQKKMSVSASKKLWGVFYEDQESFFEKTYEMVQDFDRKRFREAMGDMGAVLEKNLVQQLGKIQEK